MLPNLQETADLVTFSEEVLNGKLYLLCSGLQIGNCRFCTKFPVFKIKICGTLFKRYLHENDALHTPPFYIKMNKLNIVFHMAWEIWQRFSASRSGFLTGCFFRGPFFSQVQGPDPDPVFTRCLYRR